MLRKGQRNNAEPDEDQRTLRARNRQRQESREARRTEAELLQAHLKSPLTISQLAPGDIIATNSNNLASRAIQRATNARFSHAILYRGSGLAVDSIPGEGVRSGNLDLFLLEIHMAIVYRHRDATREQREIAAKWAYAQAENNAAYGFESAARVGMIARGGPALKALARSEVSLKSLSRSQQLSRTVHLKVQEAGMGYNPPSAEHDRRYPRSDIPTLQDQMEAHRQAREQAIKEHEEELSFMCSELIIHAFKVAGAPIVDTAARFTGPDKLQHSNVLELVGFIPTISYPG